MNARIDPLALPSPEPHDPFAPLFIGAAGENGALFERLLRDCVQDHLAWRRAFHPEDAPTIADAAQRDPAFAATVAETEAALRELGAKLRAAAPTYSPRHVGHMASDLLLPGLVAQLMTTLYNPNNVSPDVGRATIALEREVGRQLATMLGFGPAAYGHLTSGGTIANYEALWLHRAVRWWPLAVAQVAAGERALARLPQIEGRSPRELANLAPADVFALRDAVDALCAARADGAALAQRIEAARFERLGAAAFEARHGLAPPVVIAPRTAHYSWPKAMQLLGLGDAQLWYADLDAHMRLDPDSVERLLDRAWQRRVPVLAVVAVLGTTEFGTIDPVHDIVELRDAAAARGQAFALHVDAAWGGYLAALFREADGRLRRRSKLRAEFRYFPTKRVHDAFGALGAADSVTVDPHKLGFLAYGAGAFVGRDARLTRFVGHRPPYLYDDPRAGEERLDQLGDYMLEGSRSGAHAAAAYVAHRVLPLDADRFGRLVAQSVHACEAVYDGLLALAGRQRDRCTIALPVEPDTNLCCLAVNPAGNRSLARMNAFGRALYARLSLHPARAQPPEFVGSHTSLLRRNLRPAAARRVARACAVDPATFVAVPVDAARDADHVFLLRHTLMNPWLTRASAGGTVVERYLAALERAIVATLDERP